MHRVHLMPQWFPLSDPGMEVDFFATPRYRVFAQFDAFGRLLDESTILRFSHWLEPYKLADQLLGVVNAILIESGLLCLPTCPKPPSEV